MVYPLTADIVPEPDEANNQDIDCLVFQAWLCTFDKGELRLGGEHRKWSHRDRATHCDRIRKYRPSLSALSDDDIGTLLFGADCGD